MNDDAGSFVWAILTNNQEHREAYRNDWIAEQEELHGPEQLEAHRRDFEIKYQKELLPAARAVGMAGLKKHFQIESMKHFKIECWACYLAHLIHDPDEWLE